MFYNNELFCHVYVSICENKLAMLPAPWSLKKKKKKKIPLFKLNNIKQPILKCIIAGLKHVLFKNIVHN